MNRLNPKKLKEARMNRGRQKGWSRKQLEDKSRVSARQIARIEASRADVVVRESTADRLAKALKVSIEELSSDKPLDHELVAAADYRPSVLIRRDKMAAVKRR